MTGATRSAQTSAHSYVWTFPGCPVNVQLDLNVVEEVQERLARRDGAAEQGVLWGRINGVVTEISHLQLLPQSNLDAVRRALADGTCADSCPVGYYRTVPDEKLQMSEGDVALGEALFRGSRQVFWLVHRTPSGPANATFFFWDDGQIRGDFPFLEFPVDRALLESAQQRRSEVIQERFAEPSHAPPKTPRKVFRAVWVLPLVIAALALGTFVILQRNPAASAFLVKRAAFLTPPVLRHDYSIGLEATRQNGDLKLTWNRQSAAVLNASSGVLSIRDGTATREIPLGSAEVRGGSVLYSPMTDHIQMQLRVETEARTISETVIVILPEKGQAVPDPAFQPAVASQPGPSDFRPPRPLRQVLPSVPEEGTDVPKAARIQVKVTIDETGRVRNAEVLSHDNVPVSLLAETLAAARQWRFQPAQAGNHAVASEMTLTFHVQPRND